MPFRPFPALVLGAVVALGAYWLTSHPNEAPHAAHEPKIHAPLAEKAAAPAASALEKPAHPEAAFQPTSERAVTAAGQLGPGRGTLVVHFEAPPGAELSPGSPVRLDARGEHLSFPESVRTSFDPKTLPLRVPVEVTDGALGPAEVDLTYYFCTHGDDGACRPERARLTVKLDLSGAGEGGEAVVQYRPTT